MKKKIILIIAIIISIVIDLITGFYIWVDYLIPKKTILVNNQDDMIIMEIKEHFKINYDISKITFTAGFPDGYYLNIYDLNGNVKNVFEDSHESSVIYHHFDDVKADKSKYEIYLLVEICIEFLILIILHVVMHHRIREKSE